MGPPTATAKSAASPVLVLSEEASPGSHYHTRSRPSIRQSERYSCECNLGSPLREICSTGSARGDGHKRYTSRPVPTHHSVQHYLLLEKVARRMQDAKVMRLLNLILKSTGKKGVPQGGVISPVLSNLYLNEVDGMLEKARITTRRERYTHAQYARFADDMVILIDSHPRNDWLMKAVEKRLREELAKLRVEINEEKSRIVDLAKGGSFAFLGFEYRLVRSRNRKWRPQFAPKLKKRTALFAKLREIFRQHVSQPVEKVIKMINPILRGWVNYFRIGHSGRCFSKIRDWVEKKIRRHLMRARLRKGKGWKRWSSEWIYRVLGLYNDYSLRRSALMKAVPVPDGV